MSQLDLFAHYKPHARVFPFPASRRVSFAHSIAQRLAILDYASGKKLWQDVSRDRRVELRKSGHATAEITAHINRLADEVHVVLKSIELQKQYRTPAVILPMRADQSISFPHGDGAGEAGALGRGTKFLVGLGEAHEGREYDAARGRDGGAA